MAVEWEIKVDTEGNVTSSVRGMKGEGCKELTKDFSKAAGITTKDTPTREMREDEKSRDFNKSRY